jgi:hypothetical protein
VRGEVNSELGDLLDVETGVVGVRVKVVEGSRDKPMAGRIRGWTLKKSDRQHDSTTGMFGERLK